MATNQKGEGSYSDRSRILIHDPHFFKVVMFPFEQGLKIPDAFMRKYGRDLQDIVLLKVPTGASWQVEVVHYGNGTLLQKGWEEFAKYYSIKKFHFLVFRYEGNSQFHVLIFDPTALEIEYPVDTDRVRSDGCIRTSGQSGSSCVRSELKVSADDHEFEEISDEMLRKDYRATRASKGKRARVEVIEEDVSVEFVDDISKCKPSIRSSHKLTAENPGSSGCSKQKMNKGKSSAGSRRPLRSSTSISNYKTVTDEMKLKSYEKAKAFISSKPFFISLMQPSYVFQNFILEVPRKFVRAYLSIMKKRDFTLHVSGSSISWPVTLRRSGGRGRIRGSGWQKFVQDNRLRVGDACIFELVPGTRKFNITIFS